MIVSTFGISLEMWDIMRNFRPSPTEELLRQNLLDRQSRHIMIITREDDEDDAFRLVESVLISQDIENRFFIGSDFPED
jgi:hypothetical protein